MNTMAIKAFYGKEARRFSVSNSTTFAHLLSEVCTRFNLEKVPTLKFKDDEEELCVLSSDEELVEALRIAAASQPPILRVHIESDLDTPSTQTVRHGDETGSSADSGQPQPTSQQKFTDVAASTIQKVADVAATTVQRIDAQTGVSQVLETQIFPAVEAAIEKFDMQTGASTQLKKVEVALVGLDQQTGASEQLGRATVAVTTTFSTAAPVIQDAANALAASVQEHVTTFDQQTGASEHLGRATDKAVTAVTAAAAVTAEAATSFATKVDKQVTELSQIVNTAASDLSQSVDSTLPLLTGAASSLATKVKELDQATGLSESVQSKVVPSVEAAMTKLDEQTGVSSHLKKVEEGLNTAMTQAAPHINSAVHHLESFVANTPSVDQFAALASAVAVSVGSTIESARGSTVITGSGSSVESRTGSTVECRAGTTVEVPNAAPTSQAPQEPQGQFTPASTDVVDASTFPQDLASAETEEPLVQEPPAAMTESLMFDVQNIRQLEMLQLKEMGFVDEDANRKALEAAAGNVAKAVELLTEEFELL